MVVITLIVQIFLFFFLFEVINYILLQKACTRVWTQLCFKFGEYLKGFWDNLKSSWKAFSYFKRGQLVLNMDTVEIEMVLCFTVSLKGDYHLFFSIWSVSLKWYWAWRYLVSDSSIVRCYKSLRIGTLKYSLMLNHFLNVPRIVIILILRR